MAKLPEIAPALLCKTKKEFLEKLKRIEPHAKRAQYDVMDNVFVPNITVQPKEFAGLNTPVKIEAQLMVQNPEDYLLDCCRMNCWMVIFHHEALKEESKIIDLIHKIRTHKMRVGIAINPKTPATAIKPFLKLLDLALVMTVEPGFGGQELIPSTLNKLKQLRAWAPKIDIEVDGGINKGTAAAAVKAGANVLVAGNAILNAKTVKEGIAAIKAKLK